METARNGQSALLRPFYPSLDGLRAVAFLLVFAWHYILVISNIPLLRWGWVGVDIFFVLSGFLITGILYDSLSRKDYFRNFYIRRSLRIFPLYYSFWIVLLAITPFVDVTWNRYVVTMVFYIGNFFITSTYLHLHAPANYINIARFHTLIINHFWSLCVEEQFYLIWPATVWIVRSRVALLRLSLCGIVLVPVFRLIYAHLWPQWVSAGGLYYLTFSRFDSLLFGAAIALYLRGNPVSASTIRRIALPVACIAPLVLWLCVTIEGNPVISTGDPFVCTLGFSLVGLMASAILLLTLDPDRALGPLLRSRPLVALGRISYGLYFFNELPLQWLESRIPHLRRIHLLFLFPIAGFLINFIAAKLSFRFIESPFLRLKDRFAPRPGAADDPPPVPINAPLL